MAETTQISSTPVIVMRPTVALTRSSSEFPRRMLNILRKAPMGLRVPHY